MSRELKKASISDFFVRWLHVWLVAAMLAMLVLLSWGIAENNLWVSMSAGALLAAIIVMGGSVVLMPDNLRSQATERTLRMASNTYGHMRGGLTPENCNAVCQIVLPETQAQAVALTDTKCVLAYVGEQAPTYPPGSPNTRPTLEVLQSGRMETFTTRKKQSVAAEGVPPEENDMRSGGFPVGVIVPLIVADKPVGTLKLYYSSGEQIDRTQLTIARGLATLLSSQLSSHELDVQAELTARAEVKALQAQINPHFLFNTLNTIASLTRTDPDKARDLLREFSMFYRRTLESSETRIPISQELEQTRTYLTIEKARFGEDRIMEAEHVEEGLGEVLVPSFLVQPIVENSVRHAMREEGTLNIDVHVVSDGRDVLIAVADDGLGMDDEAAERLLASSEPRTSSGSGSGTGIALRNVAERIERFYGVGSGIDIMSKPGEGTVVTLRLADAVPTALQRTRTV
ncbi:MAG: histidine kinase [Coriobacteriales bacterium]|nr:histidine kinase [Coriobacteriales bacterium]